MKKKRKPKVPVHVTLSEPIAKALEALAILEGRTVSEILEDSSRDELKRRGYLPEVRGEEIAAEVAKQGRKSKQSPQNPQ